MDYKTVQILNTICFECASAPGYSLIRDGKVRPNPGGVVEPDGACRECPIADIRGAGATISAGQPGKIFTMQLIPGPECANPIDEADTWRPCEHCTHATVENGKKEQLIKLKDLSYCIQNCPAKTLRDAISEGEAEARMS